MCSVDTNINEDNQSLLVSFSNGHIKNDVSNNIKFKLLENSQTPDGLTRKRPRKILVADIGNLQYVGCNFGPDAPRVSSQCSFYIGVHNKKAKKMKLYNTQLFNLEPLLEIPDVNKDQVPSTEKSYREKIDELTSAFGSKMKKVQLESRLEQSIENSDLAAVASKAVQEAMKTPSVERPLVEETAESDVIPPQNKDTVEAKDVYSLQDIISDEEYNAIEPEAKIFIDATEEDMEQWRKEEIYSTYVLGHITELPRNKMQNHDARLLAYFHFLIQLLPLRYQEIRKKDPLPSVPEIFKEKLLNKYTIKCTNRAGKVERSMPPRMKDKIAAHALVLALFLDKMEVNLNLIQPAFKIPLNRVCTIAGALGCHVVTRKNSVTQQINKVAQLTLPLFVLSKKPLRRKKV